MSAVKAYMCDYNYHIVHEDDVVGVNPTEDLFDRLLSYPTVTRNLDKVHIHYCIDCYTTHVVLKAGMEIDRKRDESLYKLKIKELAYNFRSQVVSNWKLKHMKRK